MSSLTTSARRRAGIDPRGPRLAASITSVVLLVILLLPHTPALVLTLGQAALFATGAMLGVARTPYALAFRTWVRPRLGPSAEMEDPAPPRFAQTVGLAFTLVAIVGYAAGVILLGQIAVGLALVAALLNAVFDYCLGCELYLLVRRATT